MYVCMHHRHTFVCVRQSMWWLALASFVCALYVFRIHPSIRPPTRPSIDQFINPCPLVCVVLSIFNHFVFVLFFPFDCVLLLYKHISICLPGVGRLRAPKSRPPVGARVFARPREQPRLREDRRAAADPGGRRILENVG